MWDEPSEKVLAEIPKLYSGENTPTEEKLVYLHFFVSGCDWWITEYDGEDTFFGFACLGDPTMAEWGYISFNELRNAKIGPFEVETEINWRVRPVKNIYRLKEMACW